MKRTGGTRRKTRQKFSKSLREKGKLSLSKYFEIFKEGEKVLLKLNSAVHKGLFHGRFHGKVGLIQKKRGTCYEVEINDINKKKLIITHPIHLRKL